MQHAIESTPSADAYNSVGAWFANHHRITCAISAFEEALRLDANSWQTHYNLGLAMLEDKNQDRALSEFSAAAKENPASTAVGNALGGTLEAAGKLDEAETQFKRVLALDSHSVYAIDHLAQIYFAERRYALSIEKWREALGFSPGDPNLQLELGVAYARNGDTNRAIATLVALTHTKPNFAAGHFNLATVYADNKRFREATKEYAAALKLNPSNDAARLSLAKAYVTIADSVDALPIIRAYVKRRPDDYEGHYILGDVYRRLGKYREAALELRRALELNSSDYQTLYALGSVLARQQQPREALPYLQQALKEKPDSAEAQYRLANVLRSLNRTTEANALLQKFRKQKEEGVQQNIASAAGNAANLALIKGEPKAAAAKYREALR
ncbi:MAG: tetratricopeptide repeat protein, partial [Bryobacteraceae bacterium]